MVKYYRVLEGCVVRDADDQVIGKAGDVISLATDSNDSTKRNAARGILLGQQNKVQEVSKPEKPSKVSKPSKNKATYKTKDATPEA